MHKYGKTFDNFQWLIVVLCCMVIAIGDNYPKAFGCLEDERIGLLKLKGFINNHNRSVNSPKWDDEQVEDCCMWDGVICSDDDVFSKRIINLSLTLDFEYNRKLDFDHGWFLDASLFQPFEELQNLTLHGYNSYMFPQGFNGSLRLTKLQVLDLSDNDMSYVPLLGELPFLRYLDLSENLISHGFQELTNLSRSIEFLNLSQAFIESQFLSSIWTMTSLKKLWLSSNWINGSLPEGLCSLTYLEELDLSNNLFEGVLPTCLSSLTSLRLLDLSHNLFTGSIPSNLFFGLKSLKYLSLSHNLFDGLFSFKSLENNFRIEVFKLQNDNPMLKVETENTIWKPQLQIFILSNCILNEPYGRITPSFLLTQYDLRGVDLSNNGMNGQLPTWLIINNSRLQGLILRNNSFNGPLQLGSYNAHFDWIDISMNQVTGEIPTLIGSILPNLTYLDMSTNAIHGRIPSSIKNMRELIKLDLSNNHIYGEIPADLFYGCEKLRFLKLSNNSFTNFLSNNKSKRLSLTSLVVLDISHNSFIGRFPGLITELSSLKTLVLSKNYFEGRLPTTFCNLKDLEFLDLSGNNFSDSLPSCTHLPSLLVLNLQDNKFHGPLPTFLSKSYSLMLLDVSNNKLSGLVPTWISSFQDLTFLILSGNTFHGSIPSQLCQMENLDIIDLSANNFTRSIPPCLFHIPIGKSKGSELFYSFEYGSKLLFQNNIEGESELLDIYEIFDYHYFDVNENVQIITKSASRSYSFKRDTDFQYFISGIDLSRNGLTGHFPMHFGNWDNVRSLNLSYNHLKGSIPAALSSLTNLESLDLSHNMLSGQIPSEISKLTSLEVFSVAYNNLSGRTPTTSNQFGTFDSGSYEGNPLLCGPPLVKSCDGGPIKPSGEPEEDDSIFKIEFLWSFIGSFTVSSIGAFVYFYFCTNVPQILLQWIGIEEKTPRRRTVELPWKFINR